jgi:hypothetical protein
MKKFNDLFREYIGYLLSLLVVVAYILTAIFTLNETGQTPEQIIVSSFLIFILGVLLSNTLGHQGINDGEKDEYVLETRKEHSQEVANTQPFWHEVNDFCSFKNLQALRQERERIINFAALKYSDFFDEDDNFIGSLKKVPKNDQNKRLIKRQNIAIKKALNLHITQITATDLITESAKANDPLARGRSKQQYQVQENTKDVFGKVATALFGGLYTAQFLGAELGEIAYRIVIAVILLAFGVVRYYSNYRYITSEHRERIHTATHWLREFKSLHESGYFKKKQEATE